MLATTGLRIVETIALIISETSPPPMLCLCGMGGGEGSTTNRSDTTTFALYAVEKMTEYLNTAQIAACQCHHIHFGY